MTKEETKKCIEIMQAYVDGKKIEVKSFKPFKSFIFSETSNPMWDWDGFEYRVKPESKVRPYKNKDEFLKNMKVHGPYIHWYDSKDSTICIPYEINDYGISFSKSPVLYSWKYIRDSFTWQDGSPCGIIEN